MITNKKLLEEFTNQSQANNENLSGQLRTAIQSFEETSKNNTLSIHKQLENIQEKINYNNEQNMAIFNQAISELYQKVSQNTQTSLNQIYVEYAKRLNGVKKELEEQMDQQFSQIADLQKILYDNIVSIQKDNAIIMETLQLILTNMLIDNVKTPNKNPKIIAPERKRKQ